MTESENSTNDGIYDDNSPSWKTRLNEESDSENDAEGSDNSSSDSNGVNEPQNNNSTTKKLSSGDLKAAEENPAQDADDNSSEENQNNWRTNVKSGSKKINSRLAKLRSTKGRLGIVFGGGFFAVIGLLVMLMVFLGNQKIVGLAESVTSYNMARSARTFRQSLSQNTEAAIESEAINDTRYSALRNRFQESKVNDALQKFNSYRPAKVLEQLKSNLTPVFEDGPVSKITKKPTRIFTGWEYDGVLIEKTNTRFGFYTPKTERLRFSAELNAILEEKSYGANATVRTKVINNFLEKNRMGKLRFWDKKMLEELTPEAADKITAKKAFERTKSSTTGCVVEQICDGVTGGTKTTEETLESVTKKTAAQIDEDVAEATTKTIRGAVTSRAASTLQYTSAIYGVMMPLCLIYDGSIENSKDTIDNSERAMMQNFFMIRTSADEIKKGGAATSPEAISALSKKIGDISSSVPIKRNAGIVVDSSKEISALALPQASSSGTFSLFNVLLDGSNIPSPFIDKVTGATKDTCSVITSVWTGAGLTAAEIALAIATLGTSAEAETVAATGMRELIKNRVGALATSIGLETGFREAGILASTSALRKAAFRAGGKLILKTGLQVGAIYTLTDIAHNAVLKHMNSANNGLATDTTLANQIDMGGNLYAQGINRKFLYGKPLVGEELLQSKQADTAYLKSNNDRKNISQRYLSLSNPQSIVSKLSLSLTSGAANPGIRASAGLSRLLTSLFDMPKSLATSIMSRTKVYAEQNITGAGDYNIVQWGWTKEETDLIDSNDDYAPVENDLILNSSNLKDVISDKYSACYEKTDGELFSEKLLQRETSGEVIDKKDALCSPTNLGINNSEFGDLVFRWRLSMRNDNVINHMKEIQDVQ